MTAGYWPSRWPGEDGGPDRRQLVGGGSGLGLMSGGRLEVVSREAMASTMVILRMAGEVYLLRHTAGDDAVSWVERIDPVTLELIERSPDLPGGPTWPGGLAAHANGSLYVVFGNHAHRLAADTSLVASRELPRVRPYNSFVILDDGSIVTKDFAGRLPGQSVEQGGRRESELVVLEPDGLEIVARTELAEPSVARLSAAGSSVFVVGETSLIRVEWDGRSLAVDDGFVAPYRTLDGQTYGWDAVIAAGAAWFLDNGAGSENYAGSFLGLGVSVAPLHLVRVDLVTGSVQLTEICGLPHGLVANPPVIDEERGIAVGYDSSNGVLAAFDLDDGGVCGLRWRRRQLHASHLLLYPSTGELVTGDHDGARMMDQVVVLDISTGEELGRVDTGSPVQSVLFPAPGVGREIYTCSFTHVSRIAAT